MFTLSWTQDFLVASSSGASMGCAGQKSLIHWGPTSPQTGLKGSAATLSVPGSYAHRQRSGGGHSLIS